jgi:hypothetical protein
VAYVVGGVPRLIEQRVAVPVRRQHGVVEVLQGCLYARPLQGRAAFAELTRFLLRHRVAVSKLPVVIICGRWLFQFGSSIQLEK